MTLHEQPVKQIVTGQFAYASWYFPPNSCRGAQEGLVSQNAWEGTPLQKIGRGPRPTEGAVPGPPALLTPHRPRSPQQRAVQSQSAFASAAVRHHAGPEIPPPGPPVRAPGAVLFRHAGALVVCGSQVVVIFKDIAFFAGSQCPCRSRFLWSPRWRKDLQHPAGGRGQLSAPPRL